MFVIISLIINVEIEEKLWVQLSWQKSWPQPQLTMHSSNLANWISLVVPILRSNIESTRISSHHEK